MYIYIYIYIYKFIQKNKVKLMSAPKLQLHT